jgi:hypothetical protein
MGMCKFWVQPFNWWVVLKSTHLFVGFFVKIWMLRNCFNHVLISFFLGLFSCITRFHITMKCDALLSSLIDSNVSLKWKQEKSKELRTRSLAHNTLGLEGHAGTPRWGLGRVISINYSYRPAQTKQQVG